MAKAHSCHHLPSASELQAQMRAVDDGAPFLVYRDRVCDAGDGARCAQHLFRLPVAQNRVAVGRTVATDLSLSWDPHVSRAHCVLERVGAEWVLIDEGMSRHGSFLRLRALDESGAVTHKDVRIHGRRVLHHGDELRLGRTELIYQAPLETADDTETWHRTRVRVSDGQRRVLVALCRPYRSGDPFATPASNLQIASELFLAVETVKAHLRALFDALEVEKDVQANQKRVLLVERAFQRRVISPQDLD
jgi:FHA domain/Bacterial regulatory proteins, luxR family